MAIINDAYKNMADINLWLKTRANDELMLSDIPAIIPLRWTYFKETWEFIKPDLITKSYDNINPDFLKEQIDDFSKFIESQRVGTSKINPFQDLGIFYRYHGIFSNMSIYFINTTGQEDQIIKTELARVSSFSKNDFLKAKTSITEYRDYLADIYGLGNEDYNKSHKRSPISSQISSTIVELNYIYTVQQSIKTIDFILANLFAVDAVIDPFALARANANNPLIDIGQYRSGKLVKINYNESIQSLANRYLGSPDKWIDIAIANGLKPPYVDEVGQRILLLSNGSGNQINIGETDVNGQLNIDKFYINQVIFVQSSIEVAPDQRTIIDIKQVPVSGEIILELDGSRNLDKYRSADGAYIRVFAANTINSAFFVLIPSQKALPDSRQDEVPWFLTKSAEDEKRAKIDLALSESGDLIFTSNSDIKLSYGLENAMQAIKLKIITELGSLRRHPTFGLINVLGQTNKNVNEIKDLITQSILNQIDIDSRFDRVENISVNYLVNNGTNQGVGAIIISLSVRLAGGSQVIPISFTINNP